MKVVRFDANCANFHELEQEKTGRIILFPDEEKA